jgi:hypothetical protein
MFDTSPDKTRATRAYLIFSVLFFVFAIGTGFVMAAQHGYGAGPWDSHTVWSCNTPGGPYYLSDLPISQQPCPSPYDEGLSGKGRLPAKLAPPHPR